MPHVSVIIPTYNRASFVSSAIKSVLSQTFEDFEVLVVDDGSRDNTKYVVNSFSDPRIKYLRVEINRGISPARNLGIMNARGKYVAFLDDDDEWMPEKLQLQVDVMDSSSGEVGGIYTGHVAIDRTTGSILVESVPKKRGNLFNDLCINNCIKTASTVLLRCECLQKVGVFDEEIVFGEEYDLWIRVSKEFSFECIEKPLVKYSVHASNATAYTTNTNPNYKAVISGLEALERKYSSWFASNRKSHSYRYRSLGVLYCYQGDLTKGREAFIKAIKIYPYEPRHYFDLFLSWAGASNFKKLKQEFNRLAILFNCR